MIRCATEPFLRRGCNDKQPTKSSIFSRPNAYSFNALILLVSKALQISEPKLYVLLMRQDDPRKCTAAKLAKLRYATPIHRVSRIPRRSIVLNPFSSEVVLPTDRMQVQTHGLVAVDCSWEKADSAFEIHLPGAGRRLPILLAGNPTNYSKQCKLSSVEAMAAALYITGFNELAGRLLSSFKWGNTFLTLNKGPLESYSTANTAGEMEQAAAEFF
jgi:pre-rRNA-processing protein TSR3